MYRCEGQSRNPDRDCYKSPAVIFAGKRANRRFDLDQSRVRLLSTELQAQSMTITDMSVPTQQISGEDHFEQRNVATALRAGFEEMEVRIRRIRAPQKPLG